MADNFVWPSWWAMNTGRDGDWNFESSQKHFDKILQQTWSMRRITSKKHAWSDLMLAVLRFGINMCLGKINPPRDINWWLPGCRSTSAGWECMLCDWAVKPFGVETRDTKTIYVSLWGFRNIKYHHIFVCVSIVMHAKNVSVSSVVGICECDCDVWGNIYVREKFCKTSRIKTLTWTYVWFPTQINSSAGYRRPRLLAREHKSHACLSESRICELATCICTSVLEKWKQYCTSRLLLPLLVTCHDTDFIRHDWSCGSIPSSFCMLTYQWPITFLLIRMCDEECVHTPWTAGGRQTHMKRTCSCQVMCLFGGRCTKNA